MNMPSFTSLALALFFSVFSLIKASPTSLSARDVFVPPVLYPHAGTVWYVQQRHNVTWDTSQAPVNITNSLGMIYLRQGESTLPVILAQGFPIRDGRVEVEVPWVTDGEYSLVLFGDSGNFSPTFTINGTGMDV